MEFRRLLDRPQGQGLRMGGGAMMGGQVIRAALALALSAGLAGCGSKVNCESEEVKAALEENMEQARSFLQVYKALSPDLEMKLESSDFVTEESDDRHAICRARQSATMIKNGQAIALTSDVVRFRVDRTSEGKLVLIELKDRQR